MQDKSFINTKKLVNNLLIDIQTEINNKQNEILELKNKSSIATSLLSVSKNIHHLKPIILYLNNKEHNVGLCNFCRSVMLMKRKTKNYCSDSCRAKASILRKQY